MTLFQWTAELKKYCVDTSPLYRNMLRKMGSNQDTDEIYVLIMKCIVWMDATIRNSVIKCYI